MRTNQNIQPLEQPESDLSFKESQGTPPDKLRVLKIQRTCVHDGPGIRTTIFCPG